MPFKNINHYIFISVTVMKLASCTQYVCPSASESTGIPIIPGKVLLEVVSCLVLG